MELIYNILPIQVKNFAVFWIWGYQRVVHQVELGNTMKTFSVISYEQNSLS